MSPEAQDLINVMDAQIVEWWAERRREVEAGTAKPLPWQFSIMQLGYETECADGHRQLVEKNPLGRACPHCKAVHPLESPPLMMADDR